MELLRKLHGRDDSDCGEDTSRLPSQSDQPRGSMTRKRRRGIIEKKRRDRINNCLSELKRLVPAAFEKQGSQKLEKAEILQMTVEHLHYIRSKGADTLLYDPQRFATDYHSMGFRECATEVARYLSSVEGMDQQDPVRVRLMTHLQSYNAHRTASVAVAATTPWTGQYASSALSWSTSSGSKFESPAAVQYGISPYSASANVIDSTNGVYANGTTINQHYSSAVSSASNQAATLTPLRAPTVAGPFQPVGNGHSAATAAGLNINLAFLTSATSGTATAMTNGSSMSGIRNGWNAADLSY